MHNKLSQAQSYLDQVWQTYFTWKKLTTLDAGYFEYQRPKVVSYRDSIKTQGCGTLPKDNAYFCEGDNTIFYDEIFLAQLMKAAANELHTDGDYAPILVLAHEWGHAVHYWSELGKVADVIHPQDRRYRYALEAQADCFAGAATQRAQIDHKLDPDDLREARFALSVEDESLMIEDYNLKKIFMGHGKPEDRRRHFSTGFEGGIHACGSDMSLIAGEFLAQ